MHNKLLMAFFIILFAASFLAGQDNSASTTAKNTSGFEIFLSKNINKEISVTMNNQDTTFIGTLVAVYHDSVVIQTVFNNQVLILKESIAYIKIMPEKKNNTVK